MCCSMLQGVGSLSRCAGCERQEGYPRVWEVERRGGGLGSRPKKMYGERLGDGVEYHLMKPTPRR